MNEEQDIIHERQPRPKSVRKDFSGDVVITIEDISIETVIDMRAYMRDNGIIEKKPLRSYDLIHWLNKRL